MAFFILAKLSMLIFDAWLVWIAKASRLTPRIVRDGRSIPSVLLGIKLRPYLSQFQLANCSRRAIFLNLPTLVRGISGRKTKASGSCHLAKDLARNSRSSSGVAV